MRVLSVSHERIIMITYATVEDFADYAPDITEEDLGERLRDRLLMHASRLIQRATRAAIYDADHYGYPVDEDLRTAMREATCAQVVTWCEAGLQETILTSGATAKPRLSSTSENGSSLGFDNEESKTAAAHLLAGGIGIEALLILESAGLLDGWPTIYY